MPFRKGASDEQFGRPSRCRTSRRSFLKAAAGTLAILTSTRPRLAFAFARAGGDSPSPGPTCLRGLPQGHRIIQLTGEPDVPGSHIYMEAHIFTPDSKRFVLQRSGTAHGSDRKDPKHQFMLCDIEDRFTLYPLTDELGPPGPRCRPTDATCITSSTRPRPKAGG